jgi:hypothetical protein
LAFLSHLLVFLDGSVAGAVWLVKTMLLLEDIEESSAPNNADDNVDCKPFMTASG